MIIKKMIALFIVIIMAIGLMACGVDLNEPTDSQMTESEPTPDKTKKSMGSSIDNKKDKKDKKGGKENEKSSSDYVILEDRIIGLYKSDEDVKKVFIQIMNNLYDTIPEDIKKYIMIAPMRIAFEEDAICQLSDDQKNDIQQAYFSMDKSIETIDAYYMLSQHAHPVDDIFYRLDHHWTHLGSYYAAEDFFQAADIPYHSIEEYEKIEGKKFCGYLSAILGDKDIDKHPDDFIYYKLPGVERYVTIYATKELGGEIKEIKTKLIDPSRGGYYTFIGKASFAYAVIEGTQDSDRSVLVVGDSNMFSFSTWLADSFKTVVLIDPRYYDFGNEGLMGLIEEYGTTDFVTLSTVDALSAMAYYDSRVDALSK